MKSGTISLTDAFAILGFKSVHYIYREKRLCDIFKDNKKHGIKLLYGLEEYGFFSDFSGERFYKELDKQYPGSKFIVTVRDLDSWLISMERHVKRNQQNPDYEYDFLKIEKDEWTEQREQQLVEFKEYFKDRPEDFLIINIVEGEGWEKLCPFVGKPTPNEVFPHKNKAIDKERDSFLKRPECDGGDECERKIAFMLHPHDDFGNSEIIKFTCGECLDKVIKKIFEDAGDESGRMNIHVSEH